MKLSKRLLQIERMVDSHYTHIWDCCCDHGHLGAALLAKCPESVVHFVDIVPDLITTLENKLTRFFPDAAWRTYCLDVAKLPLQQHKGNHLIIIAGVGGDLTAEFVAAIRTNNPGLDIDFILCPVHHQYSLRQKLIELDFNLKQEALIKDNRRFYEILWVSSDKSNTQPIVPAGKTMWCSASPKQLEVAKDYLRQTLRHYQRIQQGQKMDVQPIIDAYEKVNIEVSRLERE